MFVILGWYVTRFQTVGMLRGGYTRKLPADEETERASCRHADKPSVGLHAGPSILSLRPSNGNSTPWMFSLRELGSTLYREKLEALLVCNVIARFVLR